MLTALQKLPADRFSSAKDFADALDGKGGLRRDGGDGLHPAAPSSRPRAWRRLHRRRRTLSRPPRARVGWSARPPAEPVRRYAIDLPTNQPMEWGRDRHLTSTCRRMVRSTSMWVPAIRGRQPLASPARARLEAHADSGVGQRHKPAVLSRRAGRSRSPPAARELKLAGRRRRPRHHRRGGSARVVGWPGATMAWIYFVMRYAGLSRVLPVVTACRSWCRLMPPTVRRARAWPDPLPGGRAIYRTRAQHSRPGNPTSGSAI